MNLELVKSVQELIVPTHKFDFSYQGENRIDPVDLANSMHMFMYEAGGVGLAANQVGIPHSVFVMRGDITCFNPRIVDHSENTEILEEGCISFPGLSVKVKRYSSIKIRYQDAFGETHTSQWYGLTARIAQHEFDHLSGILFYNKATRYHREFAFKKMIKKMALGN